MSLVLSRDLEVGQQVGPAWGGAWDKGELTEQRGLMGGLEGAGALAVPSLHGLVQAGCRGPPISLGAGVGSRPGELPGCCRGLGPGWRAGGLGTRGGLGQPDVY